MRSRHIPKPDRITQQQSRTQLAMLLASCTDERLSAMTAEGLAATHRIKPKEAEYELKMARQRRARG